MAKDNRTPPFGLFQRYGLELEYMIVNRDTLNVLPICHRLLHPITGSLDGEAQPDGEEGAAAWSNELALHVVEFKTAHPTSSLEGLDSLFADQVNHANKILSNWNACLMPSAMHPWMNPEREMELWPYDCNVIYKAFNRIFNCHGHGWANLQSAHINLPFANDEEFRRLHAAIRVVLPLLPALAASSPVMDNACNGVMDNRLRVYSSNCARIPQITGKVVPEPVGSRQEYETAILAPIYQALRPLDSAGTLCHEWANARGAIARFDRNSIEIRLLDIQECPGADIAIATLVCAVVRALVEERFVTIEQMNALPTENLHAVLMDAIRDGDTALLNYPDLARCLGISEATQPMSAVWRHLAASCLPNDSPVHPTLEILFQKGCLARRIACACNKSSLFAIYRELCACLADNRMFSL